jgi:hypothetical protein
MRSIVVDANLLVLLVVGLVDRELIKTHKRTRSFAPEDFDLLTETLSKFDEIVVTPNVMTEASNLASQTSEPALTAIREKFASLAKIHKEIYQESSVSVRHSDFVRLGLTDCGLLDLVGKSLPLLTTDLDLYLAASRTNHEATNFNHLRQQRLLSA